MQLQGAHGGYIPFICFLSLISKLCLVVLIILKFREIILVQFYFYVGMKLHCPVRFGKINEKKVYSSRDKKMDVVEV